MLQKLKIILKSALEDSDRGKKDEDYSSMRKLLMTVHYSCTMNLCVQHELHELASKCAVTLLRHSVVQLNNDKKLFNLVPPDKAFYVAGSLCRGANHERLAFVFLNRYIDYIEVIIPCSESIPTSFISYQDELTFAVLPY